MKVADIKDAPAQLIQQFQRAENSNKAFDKQTAGAYVSEERVDLSNMAKDIQQAKIAVDKLPEIREEKVQELKTRIEAGKYNVNGAGIAAKMVGESLIDIFA